MIKSNFARPRFEFTIPVWALTLFAKSEVPFADYGGLVSSFLHEVGEGEGFSINDQVPVGRCDSGSFFTEGVIAGKQ